MAREYETVPNFSEIYNYLISQDIEEFFSKLCPGFIQVETDACGYTTDIITLKSVATGDTLEIDTSSEREVYDYENIVKLSYHQVMMDAIIENLEALENLEAVDYFNSEDFIDNVLSNEPDFYDDIKDRILSESFNIKEEQGLIKEDELKDLIKDCAIDALKNLDEYKEIIDKAQKESVSNVKDQTSKGLKL